MANKKSAVPRVTNLAVPQSQAASNLPSIEERVSAARRRGGTPMAERAYRNITSVTPRGTVVNPATFYSPPAAPALSQQAASVVSRWLSEAIEAAGHFGIAPLPPGYNLPTQVGPSQQAINMARGIASGAQNTYHRRNIWSLFRGGR